MATLLGAVIQDNFAVGNLNIIDGKEQGPTRFATLLLPISVLLEQVREIITLITSVPAFN